MSINKVVISGNLTRDPELRETANGGEILQFSVAVNDRIKDTNGNWTDRVSYIDCTMFGARTDYFRDKLARGSKAVIDGKLHWTQWEARDGSGKKSKIEVIVDDIELMQQPRQEAAPASVPQAVYTPPAQPYQRPAQTVTYEVYGDAGDTYEIPF